MHVATFNLELKSVLRQDGTQAIRIRITKFRQHSYWNIGRYVLKSEWNKTPRRRLMNWVLKNRMAPQINDAIEIALSGLEEAAKKNPGFTAAQIKEAYQKVLNPEPETAGTAAITFFEYAAEYAARAKETTFSTGQIYEYFIAEFKAEAGEHTPLAELFSERITHRYLKALKARKNAPSTIAKKLVTIRQIYKAAVKAGHFHPLPSPPFDGVKITVPKKKRLRPTAEQVLAFFAYQPATPKQEMAKTVALLQYLLQGARIMEALSLEWANVKANHVEYLPQKKALKYKFVPRSEVLNTLLEPLPKDRRFVLPYLGEDYPKLTIKKQNYRKKRIILEVNEGLQEIADALGFNMELSSHMFRHAFADALRALGLSIYDAAAIIGHSNPKTTEGYFKDLELEDTAPVVLSIFDKLKVKEGE